jgi:hypothetical protein
LCGPSRAYAMGAAPALGAEAGALPCGLASSSGSLGSKMTVYSLPACLMVRISGRGNSQQSPSRWPGMKLPTLDQKGWSQLRTISIDLVTFQSSCDNSKFVSRKVAT